MVVKDKESMEKVRPLARKAIHPAVLRWFETQKRGSVLDAPAGIGHLSLRLREMGYKVKAGEIEPQKFAVPDIECIFTDLNRAIQTQDNSFDYICCIEGLEHMTDPYQAVKEFARVLKPGGYGVFSIPNYCNIEQRFKFLLSGYLTKPAECERFRVPGANIYGLHNSPLTITILEFMFEINNLHIVEIKKDAPKLKQYLLLPLVSCMWFVNFLLTKESRTKNRTDLTLNKNVIMGGNTLIIITKKTTKGQSIQT